MDERKRDRTLNVRCTPDETKTIEEAARRRGLSVSAWVRMTLLDAARAVSP